MQKRKLVAIVLALAMILSTFGTLPTFAAGTPTKVTLDKEYVLTGEPATLKATIKDGTKLFTDKAWWILYEDATELTRGSTSTGYITLPINASEDADVEYTVEIYSDAYATLECTSDPAVTKHDLQLSGSTSISYGDTKMISGTVKEGNGDKLDPTPYVYLFTGDVLDDDDELAIAPVAADATAKALASTSGSFALVATFEDAAEWVILVGSHDGATISDTIYASGKVSPDKNLDVSVDKDTVKANANVAEDIKVTVEDEDGNGVEGALVKISGVDVSDVDVTEGDGAYVDFAAAAAAINGLVSDDESTMYGITDDEGEVVFTAKYAKAGNEKVEVFYEDAEDDAATPDYADLIADVGDIDAFEDDVTEGAWDNSGEADYDVAASAAVNASFSSGVDMDMVDVGDGDTYNLVATVWDSNGSGIGNEDSDKDGIKKIEATVTGCGFDLTEDDAAVVDGDDDDAATLTWAGKAPKTGGVVTLKLTITFGDGSKETVTKELDVDGWQVTVTPTAWTIDTEYNLKAVVTDEDGKPINSAIVVFQPRQAAGVAFDYTDVAGDIKYVDDGKWKEDWGATIDGADENINDGAYTATVKVGTADKYTIGVYNQAHDLQAWKNIEVYGDATYTIKLDPATLILGNDEDLDITAKDADGETIDGDDFFVTIDGDDYGTAAFAVGEELSRDDDVYTVDGEDICANIDEAGTYDVYFRSSDRSELGKATVTFVEPKVDLGLAADALTDSMKEDLTIKVTDPRDNSAIEDVQVRFSVEGAFANIYAEDADDPEEELDDVTTEYEYPTAVDEDGLKVSVMAWDDEDNDTDEPVVKVEVNLTGDAEDWTEVKTLAVKEMTITANPANIPVDKASVMAITVKDAQGDAMANAAVELSGAVSAESETDANGTVSFMVKPGASGTIYIKVETDREDGGDTVYAEAKAHAVFGGGSTGGTGIVEIKLQVGNKNAQANGQISELDVAPFIENGRTLMPFRYIGEALGAKVEWIAAGNKVTFTSADGKIVIELVLGSAEAKVNGAVKTLDVPAKVVNGRTVVPVRFISENMGCYVNWDFATNAITITK